MRAWQTAFLTSADSSDARRKREEKKESMLAANEGGLVMMKELRHEMDWERYFALVWSVEAMSLGMRKSRRRCPLISMSSCLGRSSQTLKRVEKAPWEAAKQGEIRWSARARADSSSFGPAPPSFRPA